MTKILTLSRAGGGRLDIHPNEWPALVEAASDSLDLAAAPDLIQMVEGAIQVTADSPIHQLIVDFFDLDPSATAPEAEAALKNHVVSALRLAADPADALEEDRDPSRHVAPSPLGNYRKLVAEFSIFGVDRPLAGHHRDNLGSD